MSAFTEANRKAFDKLSAEYNAQAWQVRITQQVSDALNERKDWLGAQWTTGDEADVRLLDYACGTGAITKSLGPFVKTIRGIDISGKMVEKYNEAAQSSGLKPEQANAVVGDLCGEVVQDHLNTPEYHGFDIAVIGLGFHHMEEPPRAMQRLSERLKPGTGVLVIVDFLPFDRNAERVTETHEMRHTIKHNGFTSETMGELYASAGFEDFGFDVLKEPTVMELKDATIERTMFISRGRMGRGHSSL